LLSGIIFTVLIAVITLTVFTDSFNTVETVKVINAVILAWMPESSAKDDNCMIISNIILHSATKTSLRSPCDWIPASLLERRGNYGYN
jgi:hypothetical protein